MNGIKGMDRLLELQELDLSIDRLRSQVALLESQRDVREARARLVEVETRLGELRLSLDAVAREQRSLEGDVDSLDRKIRAEETRLYDGSVANAKELQSIGAEVENLQNRKARFEDQLIERMEEREQLESSLASVDAEMREEADRVAEIEGRSGRDLAELRRALAERQGEREGLVGEFDPTLLKLYEDLRRQKKGVGAAALEDGVCGGCHQKNSPLELDRMKRTQGIRRCEYCRRILVFT